MFKRFIAVIAVVFSLTMGVWGFFKVNIVATEAFNSNKYEITNVNYKDIKEKTGLDLKKLSKDNSFIKTYDIGKKFVVVFGDYKIDLNETIAGRVIVNIMDTIDSAIKKADELAYEILY